MKWKRTNCNGKGKGLPIENCGMLVHNLWDEEIFLGYYKANEGKCYYYKYERDPLDANNFQYNEHSVDLFYDDAFYIVVPPIPYIP